MAYELKQGRKLVVKAGNELSQAGLVARTWGNISAKISEDQYVITPSGRDYKSLTDEDIVIVNRKDGSYEGNIRPSGEKGIHSAAYELRNDVQFVIHTHQNFASALSILETVFPVEGENERNVLGEEIPCAAYGMYATEKLIHAVRKEMQEHPLSKAVLMKNHGALCMGNSYEEAFSVAYALEKESRYIMRRLCGNRLPDEKKKIEKFELPKSLKKEIERVSECRESICSAEPYTVAVSRLGKTVYPYLDDLAQIAGISVRCAGSLDDASEIVSELSVKNAILIKNRGAICTGTDKEEAEAVVQVLEKACIAAYLANKIGNIRPISYYHAKKDRQGYINSYSKLK